ncbi:MAG: hypothetical protein PSV35_03785 [bacterium]|nr:hypothetical protein [bacterium]
MFQFNKSDLHSPSSHKKHIKPCFYKIAFAPFLCASNILIAQSLNTLPWINSISMESPSPAMKFLDVTKNWTQGVNIDWDTGSNWSPSGIPLNDEVITVSGPASVANKTTDLIIGDNANGALTIADGAQVNINKALPLLRTLPIAVLR